MPRFYTAEDLMHILPVGRSKAYDIIKKLNAELAENGYVVISGCVPVKYFNEKFYC